jgi:predicted dehydrogenase/aryl-alcohol dehydrogenase-like predicted oxidoreductase
MFNWVISPYISRRAPPASFRTGEVDTEGIHRMATLSWGILGTGTIARTFACALPSSRTGRLVAVASRTVEKARQFVNEHAVRPHDVTAYGDYDALLSDPAVQAVYISTPHPEHAYWAVRCAAARKHVLCEKPIGLNDAEAAAIVEAAREHGVFLMEAFMYRCHPQTARIVELIREKAIGDVRVIQAAFGFRAPYDPQSRLYNNRLAGGGILDVGCYPVSMARLLAGAAVGKPFADPTDVQGVARLGATGVDEHATAVLKFPGDIAANVATAVAVELDNTVRVFGTDGHLFIPNPWIPAREGGEVTFYLHKAGAKEPEPITVKADRNLYAYEADVAAEGIWRTSSAAASGPRGQAAPPAMTWDDTLGNARTLTRWRRSVGLTYEAERAENVQPIARRPLAVRPGARMSYGEVAGVSKKISRLVLGVDNETFAPHLAVLLDDFFEHGGTCLDTAHIYGPGGACERALGAWIKSRGVREQIVILDKGGHDPWNTPDWVTRQHRESLERLGTDYVDLYMLHRDNPAVPVGEFADALHEHVRTRTIRAIGASNWTHERIDAFNAYARQHGKTPFAAVSNNLSLCRMVEAPWRGCLSSNTPASRAWHERTRTPLFAWSSQGRGYFVDAQRDTDPEVRRCWESEDNAERLARATELARSRDVLPIQIALAWTLHQPFPTFALIGPRTLRELRDSLRGLAVKLTADDVAWLALARQ